MSDPLSEAQEGHEVKVSTTDRSKKRKKEEKAHGYAAGPEWYNPLTVIPHTMLQQTLPPQHERNIDVWLKSLAMMLDDMGTVIDVTVTQQKSGLIASYRSKFRVTYCVLMDVLLALNIIRMFAVSFVRDPIHKMYWGDMSFMWTSEAHYITIPMMWLHLGALLTNLCFQVMQASDVSRRWLVPFGIFTRTLTPVSVRIKSIHHLKMLVQAAGITSIVTSIIMVTWSGAAGLLYVASALRADLSPAVLSAHPNLRWIAISWSLAQSMLTSASIGIICWCLGYFCLMCWHLRCRFKRLNKITYSLQDDTDRIPDGQRNEFMTEVIFEHNDTCYDTYYANRFWKYTIAIQFAIYVPIAFWLLYTCCFYDSTGIVRMLLWITFAQTCLNLILLITAGDAVSHEAHCGYPWLNTIMCKEVFPVNIKFKMSEQIERLASTRIGFYCHDAFAVTRESAYEMMLFLGTFFFLMSDFVRSYKEMQEDGIADMTRDSERYTKLQRDWCQRPDRQKGHIRK